MSAKQEYEEIKALLLSRRYPLSLLAVPSHPVNQKTKPKHESLVARIAALQLHPNLESLLHIMNTDLTSAHFLLRHMEGSAGYEAKMLHGLLHRIEGDMENAKLWYGDAAGSTIFDFVWREDVCPGNHTDKKVEQAIALNIENSKDEHIKPGSEEAQIINKSLDHVRDFIDDIRNLREIPQRQRDQTWEGEYQRLEETSQNEIERLFEFIEAKFGTGRVEEASRTYQKKDQKHSEQASKQIIGGEGWREF